MNYQEQRRKLKCGFTNIDDVPASNKKIIIEQVAIGSGKTTKFLNKMSEVEKKRQKKYMPLARAFRKDNPQCQLRVVGVCTSKTEAVHHTIGKVGELLCETKYWMASCFACNNWVEDNHAKAVELNLIGKRNTETKRYENTYKSKK